MNLLINDFTHNNSKHICNVAFINVISKVVIRKVFISIARSVVSIISFLL